MNKPTFPLLLILSLSICSSISSLTWIMMWMFMELNMFCFIPLIKILHPSNPAIMMKYFMAQSIGSMTIIMVFLSQPPTWSFILITLACFMKMGIFPLHQWMINIISSMTWFSTLLILTVQKLIPCMIMMLSSSMINSFIFTLPLLMILTSVMMLNFSNLYILLAISSMINIYWIIIISKSSLSLSLLFILTYMISLLFLFFCIKKSNLLFLKSATKMQSSSSISISIAILSIAGLPPLPGFIMKFLAILKISNISMMMSIMMILSSAISMYFYIRMTLTSFLNFFQTSLYTKSSSMMFFIASTILILMF